MPEANTTRKNGYYNYKDTYFPAVSKITGFIGGAEGLMHWACELGGNGVIWGLRGMKAPDLQNYLDSPSIMAWAREMALRGLNDEQNRVQGFGKKVHYGIECRLKNINLDTSDWLDGEKTALDTFDAFYKQIGFDPYLVEAEVYSPLHRFAGRLDLVAEVTEEQALKIAPYLIKSSPPIEPGLILTDFKTGSFYKDSHGIQLSSYRQAVLESNRRSCTGGLVMNIAREDPSQVKCYYYPASVLDDCFQKGFLPAKAAWEFAGSPQWYKKELLKPIQ